MGDLASCNRGVLGPGHVTTVRRDLGRSHVTRGRATQLFVLVGDYDINMQGY